MSFLGSVSAASLQRKDLDWKERGGKNTSLTIHFGLELLLRLREREGNSTISKGRSTQNMIQQITVYWALHEYKVYRDDKFQLFGLLFSLFGQRVHLLRKHRRRNYINTTRNDEWKLAKSEPKKEDEWSEQRLVCGEERAIPWRLLVDPLGRPVTGRELSCNNETNIA